MYNIYSWLNFIISLRASYPFSTLLVDDDLIARAYVVAVQLLVRILHLFGTLMVAQVLVHVVQAHFGGRNVHDAFQPRLEIDNGSGVYNTYIGDVKSRFSFF